MMAIGVLVAKSHLETMVKLREGLDTMNSGLPRALSESVNNQNRNNELLKRPIEITESRIIQELREQVRECRGRR